MRDEIVELVDCLALKTGVSISTVLRKIEISKPRFYDWKKRLGTPNQHNGLIPKDSWITANEREAILRYYSKHPGNGCKRLSYMMIDEDIAYVSHNTVYRVLKSKGLLDPKPNNPSLKGTGFDQPTRPHEQWHIDVSYINAGGTFYYLCSVLDGYSRFIVDWEIRESMKQEDCQLIVQRARDKTGDRRARLISDNGPQFKAKQFREFIKFSGMDQTYTSPYYPQSNGKIERWHKELKKSCIRPKAPRNLAEAKEYVADYIELYNYGRLHSAIGYVTPYRKLLGIEAELHKERKEKLEKAKLDRKLSWEKIRRHQASSPASCDHRMEPSLTIAGGGESRRSPVESLKPVPA